MDSLELLLHPLRLRIVHALSGGRALTTTELRERMPEISKATMYRQVSLLADGGLIEVVGEHRVGGAVEREYQLCQARAVISAKSVASASLDDFRRAFAVAMATLLGEFDAYLDRGSANPVADAVGFRQHALWLNPRERDALIGDLRQIISPQLVNEPGPGRRLHLLSPILFPIDDPLLPTSSEEETCGEYSPPET